MKKVYKKTHRTIEMVCKIIYLLMAKVSVACFVFPKAIISFYFYSSTDLGNDAFDLPIPTW